MSDPEGTEAITVKIKCPKCKNVQDVDGRVATCPDCRTVLRRCADCTSYDVRLSFCSKSNKPIETGEASYPSYSSPSTYCEDYTPSQPPE